ncbi:hypothetical protein RUM44_002027 [Polyplax serrata]|uniref:Secreted protein n=1 Tax=Polyplax serrata TaxID=468196 RepID=A0ABR1ALQ9_POLSC
MQDGRPTRRHFVTYRCFLWLILSSLTRARHVTPEKPNHAARLVRGGSNLLGNAGVKDEWPFISFRLVVVHCGNHVTWELTESCLRLCIYLARRKPDFLTTFLVFQRRTVVTLDNAIVVPIFLVKWTRQKNGLWVTPRRPERGEQKKHCWGSAHKRTETNKRDPPKKEE